MSQLLSVCNPSGSHPGWLPGTSYGGARPRLFVGNVRVELTPAAYRSSAPCALNPDPGAGIAAALHCANLPQPVPEASRSGTALNQGIKEVRECSLSNRRTPLCGSASLVRCRLHCTPARNRVHRLERLDYAASPSALQANQSSRNHTKLNTCTTSNLLPIEATRPRLPWPGASRISGPSFFPGAQGQRRNRCAGCSPLAVTAARIIEEAGERALRPFSYAASKSSYPMAHGLLPCPGSPEP